MPFVMRDRGEQPDRVYNLDPEQATEVVAAAYSFLGALDGWAMAESIKSRSGVVEFPCPEQRRRLLDVLNGLEYEEVPKTVTPPE